MCAGQGEARGQGQQRLRSSTRTGESARGGMWQAVHGAQQWRRRRRPQNRSWCEGAFHSAPAQGASEVANVVASAAGVQAAAGRGTQACNHTRADKQRSARSGIAPAKRGSSGLAAPPLPPPASPAHLPAARISSRPINRCPSLAATSVISQPSPPAPPARLHLGTCHPPAGPPAQQSRRGWCRAPPPAGWWRRSACARSSPHPRPPTPAGAVVAPRGRCGDGQREQLP